MTSPRSHPQPARHWMAFFAALGIALIIFTPFVIHDRGYFIYYGDFNVQQIPFYKLAHEAVRSGDLFWNWYTDLGVNFIGSYSFYLLFSPFFWLTLPFPTSWLPFLMAPLLVLKTACASLTAYLYLQRFVKDNAYAVVGALLYAFSGWMDFNIFFNHFHEVAVFFPLLLLGVEQLVEDGRRGVLAVAVLINAMVNYWFFVGEAVFVVLYVLVRMSDPNWSMTPRKFFALALESVLGVGCAALVLIPSAQALMGNPRTGAGELLTGWSFWLYWHEQRQPAILQSLFLPPELPARPNFFPDHGAKWASLSGWLPLVGMTGVLAYFFRRREDWLKKLLALCLLFALVPGLNSLFILFNNSYYARWFYMPVLLMALATMRAVEDSATGTEEFARAIKWSALITLAFVLMCGATPNIKDGSWALGMAPYPYLLWIYAAVAMLSLVGMTVLILYLRHHRNFRFLLGTGVAAVAVTFTIFYMANGKNNYERTQYVINTAIGGRELVNLPQDPFARSDVYDGSDNLLMFWHLPNIQAFHSIVPPSIMEFYPAVGVKRDVGSRPEAQYYALRPLLSVRWLFIQADKEQQSPMPGYTKYGEQAGFNVYENENYLPMGFAYDQYVTREQLEEIDTDLRSNLMLRAVVLERASIRRNEDILFQLDTDGPLVLNADAMTWDVEDRRQFTADSFAFDNRGFSAATSFDQEELLFFSVPYDSGWSATVNGEEAIIERANIGFMAVRVPAGDCQIRFSYRTPGLIAGLAGSVGGLLLLAAYLLLCRGRPPLNSRLAPLPAGQDALSPLREGRAVTLSEEAFRTLFPGEQRSVRLQQQLNEAGRRHIEDALDPGEQTLRFQPSAGDDNSTQSGQTTEEIDTEETES